MEGTIGEIRLFASTFSPRNWAFCQNQILNISSNTALFSILGTTYGGNGQTSFGLPDFRGRIAIGRGQGPGLSDYSLGETSGIETKTIGVSNFPAHTHQLDGTINMPSTVAEGNSDTSSISNPASFDGTNMYATGNDGSGLSNMNTALTASNSGNASPVPINNIQPVLGMNFVVCMFGVFPARN